MSHNDELIDELRAARLKRQEAREAMNEAEVIFKEKKTRYKQSEALIDEILEEIETGQTGRPVMDAIAARNGTIAPPPEMPPERRAEPESLCDLHPPGAWTSDELVIELRHALSQSFGYGDAQVRLLALRDSGATTDQVVEILRKCWPDRPKFVMADVDHPRGYACVGGNRPAFWMGSYAQSMRPTFEGDALIYRIRGVLGIPTPTEAAKKSGYDLVTSRPDSKPATNGVPEKPAPPKKRGRKKEAARA
jgi:hypothetical protein